MFMEELNIHVAITLEDKTISIIQMFYSQFAAQATSAITDAQEEVWFGSFFSRDSQDWLAVRYNPIFPNKEQVEKISTHIKNKKIKWCTWHFSSL